MMIIRTRAGWRNYRNDFGNKVLHESEPMNYPFLVSSWMNIKGTIVYHDFAYLDTAEELIDATNTLKEQLKCDHNFNIGTVHPETGGFARICKHCRIPREEVLAIV